eukprot:6458203-Amphidinium_carterae.2
MPPKRIYEGKFRSLHEPPLVFVAVLGHRAGRWCEEFGLASVKHLRECVIRRCREAFPEAESEGEWRLYGFAIMPAWEIVASRGIAFTDAADVSDSKQTMHNLLLYQSTLGVRAVIEWSALAVAFLEQPHDFVTSDSFNLSEYGTALDSPTFSRECWTRISGLSNVREVVDGHQGLRDACSVSELWRRWSARFQIATGSSGVPPVVGWRMWDTLAILLCKGLWFGDLVAIHQRVSGKYSVRLRSEAPPANLTRTYDKGHSSAI